MEQIKALNALEPFLALSKSASSPRAAADLITRATSVPNTFVFTELLATPQIQVLSSSTEYASSLALLQIFSYGTYTDYTLSTGLPPLNDAQTLKLRQLSFLTLAKNPSDLTYTNLQHALGLSSARELEDLIISAIYAGLITGTLDPYHQLVSISSIAPLRDLAPNSIPDMLSTLNAWSLRCSSTLSDLERQIAAIKSEAARRHKDEAEWAKVVDRLTDAGVGNKSFEEKKKESAPQTRGSLLNKFMGAKRGSNGMDEDDLDMDLDQDDDEDIVARGPKRRGLGNPFGKS